MLGKHIDDAICFINVFLRKDIIIDHKAAAFHDLHGCLVHGQVCDLAGQLGPLVGAQARLG